MLHVSHVFAVHYRINQSNKIEFENLLCYLSWMPYYEYGGNNVDELQG